VTRATTKNLLLGFDALDPPTLDRLIARGLLPNFQALRDRSRRDPIENYPGMGAGAFWPSVATGHGPDVHGRYYCVQFDPHSYEIVRFDETQDFAGGALWSELDREGYRVGLIDWPESPIGPLSNGFVLDNWLAHDPLTGARSFPPKLARRTERRWGADPWAGGVCGMALDTAEAVESFVEQAAWRVRTKTDFAVDAMRRQDWDLLVPVFTEMHDFGHYCQHLSNPDHPQYDPEIVARVGDPIERAMRLLDVAVGRLVEEAGPSARIMVLGGPGMTMLASANGAMEAIARRLDAGGEGRRFDGAQAVRSGRRAVPAGLRRLIAPLIRPLKRRALGAGFAHRRFFAVPHNANAGCIRFNIKGREARGRVAPGAERDALADELTEEFLQLRDAETGASVVEAVLDARKVFDGPRREVLPDLFVVWRRDKPIRRIASPRVGEVAVPPSHRTGDHTPGGLFWMRGATGGSNRPPNRPHDTARAILEAVRA
jgi:predicted AlkP superfamily phosphohydrolase/phosphomutase